MRRCRFSGNVRAPESRLFFSAGVRLPLGKAPASLFLFGLTPLPGRFRAARGFFFLPLSLLPLFFFFLSKALFLSLSHSVFCLFKLGLNDDA